MRMPSLIRVALIRAALAGAVLAFAGAAHAQLLGAQICYSPEQPFGAAPPTNATVFNCPAGGDATLPQLASSNWRIVKLTPVVASATTERLQLVIRRNDIVFRNGFQQP
ncbi:MAG TPA: hypothetical protein VM555_04825 [Tahibacter sp.]|nr:hypothetical protein [Tahibacter sp.]